MHLLKKIHHKYLVWRMLRKKRSIFGNQIHKIEGVGKKSIDFDKKMKKPSISVIVLSHNNKNIIFDCIDSLLKFNDYSYEIIVVDNKSSDGSAKLLQKKYKNKIKLILNEVNGCASGRNLGAMASNSEYLIFIDSDQGADSHGWMDNFIRIFNNFSNIGAIGWHGGFFTEPNLTGPSFSHYKDNALPNKYLFRTNVDYLETGGLMIKKTFLNKLNGFDTIYDPYTFADADLSRKVVEVKKKLVYCPSLNIYHRAHSTTKADMNRKEYSNQFSKNAIYFRKKWIE